MDDHVVVLDTCQYERKDNGTCVLSGWMCVNEEREEHYFMSDILPHPFTSEDLG